jgi:di/tricarboxylate transporter
MRGIKCFPPGHCLQSAGDVDLAANALSALTSCAGAYGVLATLFAATVLLGMFISNTATAVLVASVAIAVAKEMQAPPSWAVWLIRG